MGRSQETFNKKEVRLKKEKRRKEKEQKRQDRKGNESSGFDDMIAYVDQNGVISATPPDPQHKQEIQPEDIILGSRNNNAFNEIDPIRRGIVSFFNESKGFGFIRDLESRESLYVHASQLLEPIKENQQVEFEREKGVKGPTAVRVKVVRK